METKKEKIVSAVATIGIILTLFGATYAYFAARGDTGKITDVEITANTVDVFSFETGYPISININHVNFASGKGNQTDSTFARATLSANNKTNTATEHYYLYLSILENTFTYSKDSTYPEILIKITDPNGNELTSNDVDGLNYLTATDASGNTISGFDITTGMGLFTIVNNREITTTSKIDELWNFEVTFVNYDFNQADNAGKNIYLKVKIVKEKLKETIADICEAGDNLADCVTALGDESEAGVTGLYYHGEKLSTGAKDNSYRYSGGGYFELYTCNYNGNEVINYHESDYIYYKYHRSGLAYNKLFEGECSTVYKVLKGGTEYYYSKSEAEYIDFNNSIEVAWDEENNVCKTVNGDEDVYVWRYSEISDSSLCTGTAYKDKYSDRYYVGIEKLGAGVEALDSTYGIVKNYVCFGYDEKSANYDENVNCPENNLYRIIGVFDGKIKLIKDLFATPEETGINDYCYFNYDYDDVYRSRCSWNSYTEDDENTTTKTNSSWSNSPLNKVNLNENYLNYLGTNWSQKIANSTWVTGGDLEEVEWGYENGIYLTSQEIYQKEMSNPIDVSTAKIGLMYASDILYAKFPSYWNEINRFPYVYNNNYNWMYMSTNREILLTSDKDYNVGGLHWGEFSLGYEDANLRPTFYLKSDVTYLGGIGTYSNPIKLS